MLAQRTAQIAAPADPGEAERIESRAAMRTVEMPPELPPGDATNDCEIATLIGMTPPDACVPRYVANEPRAVKIMQPVRRTWWTRFAIAVRAVIRWRPKRARARHAREKIAAISREAVE